MTDRTTQAFPAANAYRFNEGMDLRDYFAAKAMVHLLDRFSTYESTSREAYNVADAMMKARSK